MAIRTDTCVDVGRVLDTRKKDSPGIVHSTIVFESVIPEGTSID